MGDNGSDSTTDVYDAPKELIIWGEDQTTMSIPNLRKKVQSLLDELQLYEDALREKDKGYTGRTIVASAPGLVNELQQTIAEQEKELEKKDKELKKQENYYLGKMEALIDKLPYPTMSKEDRERADNIETITAEMLDEAVRSLNKLK
jgi:flagellar biosynthesis chaperone FliJ